jgi:glycerophosphoryl diester phosphodiesterase
MSRTPLRAVTAAALLATWALGAAAQAWPPTPTVIAHLGPQARAHAGGLPTGH